MKRLFISVFLLGVGLFAQVPAPPPQPSTSPYSVTALELLPTYDRASYQKVTGTQAPPFDISKPAKSWFDSTASGSVTYQVFNGSLSSPAFLSVTMPSAQANTVNLPGLPTFATYAPQVSNIVISIGTCQGATSSGYSGSYQSTLDQAMALLNEIGDSTLVINTGTGSMFPGSSFAFCKIEPSNPISIYKLGNQNVGLMLQQRNAKGVGYPGSWGQKDAQGYYTFTPAVLNDGSTSTLGSIGTPSRALLPNEKLISVVNGIIPTPEIVRTDLTPTPSTGPSGDGFGSDDRATMSQILKAVQALKAVFGIQ